MRTSIFSLLMVALITVNVSTAHADEAKTEVADPTANLAPSEPLNMKRFTVGGGLSLYNGTVAKAYNYDFGKVGLDFDFAAMFRLSQTSPFFLGVTTGISYWGVQATTYSTYTNTVVRTVEAYNVPFLPTAMYQFDISKRLHPYISASVGPALYVDTQDDNLSDRTTKTRVVFEWYVQPGLDIDFGKHFGLNVAPKLGTLDGIFIFQSTVGALFRF